MKLVFNSGKYIDFTATFWQGVGYILLVIVIGFMFLSALSIGIDNNESYQNRVMNNHMEIWEVD